MSEQNPSPEALQAANRIFADISDLSRFGEPVSIKEWSQIIDEEFAALRAENERLWELLQRPVADSHYAHHDPKGTAGRHCPACQARQAWRDEVRTLIDAARKREEG